MLFFPGDVMVLGLFMVFGICYCFLVILKYLGLLEGLLGIPCVLVLVETNQRLFSLFTSLKVVKWSVLGVLEGSFGNPGQVQWDGYTSTIKEPFITCCCFGVFWKHDRNS